MKHILIISILVFITACAVVTSPTGGPKDETPPKLLLSSPIDQSTNFKGNQIVLEFDEFIQLINPQDEIIVTPSLKEKPEYSFRKNQVIVKFNEKLNEATTYSINFREAISDLNEKNPAQNLSIAFSTGAMIDTASISGTVIDLLTQEPIKDATIGLYLASDTLNMLNNIPLYMTKSSAKGEWKIRNISPNKYRLYTVKDVNKNSMIEMEKEKYGFLPEVINISGLHTDVKLSLIKNDVSALKLMSARTSGKYFQVRYNKTLSDFHLQSEQSLSAHITDNNIIKFYNTITADSAKAIITAIDSLGRNNTDTVFIKFSESPRKYDDYIASVKLDPLYTGQTTLNGNFTFTKPARAISDSTIFVEIDSLHKISISTNDLKWDEHFITANFSIPFKSITTDSTNYKDFKLHTLAKTFISADNDSSKALSQKIVFSNKEKTGSIETKITIEEKSFIVQLLDSKYIYVSSFKDKLQHSFNLLNPKDYILRVLIDNNNNGTWDLGNILENIPPEEVFIYRNEAGKPNIILRENFIIGPIILEK